MSESKSLSRQFDDATQLYDEVRPRYPEEIIEHIMTFVALPSRGRVFEVGCGTGQMTLPFAQRGYTVVALDQGERLAALAAQPCQPYPQVQEGLMEEELQHHTLADAPRREHTTSDGTRAYVLPLRS